MTLTVKGFVGNATKVNNGFVNGKGAIATFGELSPDSKTFAKELGYYPKENSPLFLVTFTCQNENGIKQSLPDSHNAITRDVYEWIYSQSRMSPALTLYELTYKFNQAFANRPITEVEFGEMAGDGTDNLPWFIWFVYNGTDAIKLWFGDEWFSAQYDDFEIEVLPALEPTDDFWLAGNIVAQRLKLNDLIKHAERVQEIRDGYPPTVVRTEKYTYYDPRDRTHTEDTYFTAIIYGPAGDNIDHIQDAFVDYVLAHSVHSREEWITIIPDLFRRSEFYIVPMWDKLAIETTQTGGRGIYSAVSNVKTSVTRLTTLATDYNAQWVATGAETWAHHYKPLSIYSIANAETRDSKFSISDWYPKYIPVPSTSPDFNRMDTVTQEWSLMMADLLYHAEQQTKWTAVPRKYSKVVRGGKVYIVGIHNRLKFLVYAKMNGF